MSIAGGKLITYRTTAAEVTDVVLRQLGRPRVPCRTSGLPLGAETAPGVARLAETHPELAEPLVPGLPYLKAHAAYAAQSEMAVLPEDVLFRRTRIAHLECQHGEPQRQEVARLIARFREPGGGAPRNVPSASAVVS